VTTTDGIIAWLTRTPAPWHEQLTFFSEEDISSMFSVFDPTGKGHISPAQYEQGAW
jgi:hypothetical protein